MQADVSQFDIPDGPRVFCLFAPFKRKLMTEVIQNIEREYRSRPRKMYIVCARTWYRDLLDAQPWLSLQRAARPWWLWAPTGGP